MPKKSNCAGRSGFVEGIGWAFLAALALAPLIYGANVPLAWGINAVVFGLLLVLLVLVQTVKRRPVPVLLSRLWFATAAFGVVFLWIFLQTQTWMPESLHAPIWRQASNMLGEELSGTISVNPTETQLGLFRLATAIAVFFLALQLGRERQWARRIVICIAVAGMVHAVYAMGLRVTGAETAALFLPDSFFKLDQTQSLTGTFINRDHFAIYLGLSVTCAWALLVHDLRTKMVSHGFDDHRETVAKIYDILTVIGWHAVLLMPLTVAILMTASRAGFILPFTAILLVAVLEWYSPAVQTAQTAKVDARGRRFVWIPVGIALVGILIGLLTHGDDLGGRLAGASAANDIDPRINVAAITLKAVADRPFLGHGYGTFADVFPVYRDSRVPSGRWEEAHNSYLEALLGLGIPAALILLLGFSALIFRCWRGVTTRKRDRLAPIVALAATLIVGLHVLVDFSIQIQGIALTYAALLGAGCAQSWSSREV
jgi:O-antigen ligase